MVNSVSFDVIIIGGGAAGISAAMWCDELKLKSLLLESNPELGGQLLWTHNKIENYLGSKAGNGIELRNRFVEQMKDREFSFRLNASIKKIDLAEKIITLKNGETLAAKSLIIATGVRRRTLGIEGEDRFKDKGILSSGKRDKDLVYGKTVLIIGGGDAALENSLILAETAAKVYVAHRRKEFRARSEFIEAAKVNKKIEFLYETSLKKIIGNEKIESVELKNINENENYSLPIDAVLFRLGVEPNTSFLGEQIAKDKNGYIIIDSFCATNIKGIYAVGDVANPISPTISSAVGMGATSIKAIYSQLK